MYIHTNAYIYIYAISVGQLTIPVSLYYAFFLPQEPANILTVIVKFDDNYKTNLFVFSIHAERKIKNIFHLSEFCSL